MKKFYWNPAMLIHLDTICGCFQATVTELSSCGKDHGTHKAYSIYYLVLYGNSLLALDWKARQGFSNSLGRTGFGCLLK